MVPVKKCARYGEARFARGPAQARVEPRIQSIRDQRRERLNVSGGKGFFTDTTLCIGCKACEVACKQWNQLPEDGYRFTGNSYDNTMHLGGQTWRHVGFIERPVPIGSGFATQAAGNFSWLMMSDVCKHCQRAGCLEACP